MIQCEKMWYIYNLILHRILCKTATLWNGMNIKINVLMDRLKRLLNQPVYETLNLLATVSLMKNALTNKIK